MLVLRWCVDIQTNAVTWIEYDPDHPLASILQPNKNWDQREQYVRKYLSSFPRDRFLDISTMLLLRPIENFCTGEILHVDLQLSSFTICDGIIFLGKPCRILCRKQSHRSECGDNYFHEGFVKCTPSLLSTELIDNCPLSRRKSRINKNSLMILS